jgi:hypothetical protein
LTIAGSIDEEAGVNGNRTVRTRAFHTPTVLMTQ